MEQNENHNIMCDISECVGVANIWWETNLFVTFSGLIQENSEAPIKSLILFINFYIIVDEEEWILHLIDSRSFIGITCVLFWNICLKL
jgi:hypothetical protein